MGLMGKPGQRPGESLGIDCPIWDGLEAELGQPWQNRQLKAFQEQSSKIEIRLISHIVTGSTHNPDKL